MRAEIARRGSALIEVLVAIVLLAVSGTALVTLLGQTAATLRTAAASEDTGRRAAAELNRLTIASRAELLARGGRNSVRGWIIDIERESEDLFAVNVYENDTAAPVLHTTLYRPAADSDHASR